MLHDVAGQDADAAFVRQRVRDLLQVPHEIDPGERPDIEADERLLATFPAADVEVDAALLA